MESFGLHMLCVRLGKNAASDKTRWGSVGEVVGALGLEEKHTNAARNLNDNVRSMGFIFQVGENEINANGQGTFDWRTASFERRHTVKI